MIRRLLLFALALAAMVAASPDDMEAQAPSARYPRIILGARVGSAYGLGQQIEVAVLFTRSVTVTGTPRLALTFDSGMRQANYAEGTGTDSLTLPLHGGGNRF